MKLTRILALTVIIASASPSALALAAQGKSSDMATEVGNVVTLMSDVCHDNNPVVRGPVPAESRADMPSKIPLPMSLGVPDAVGVFGLPPSTLDSSGAAR